MVTKELRARIRTLAEERPVTRWNTGTYAKKMGELQAYALALLAELERVEKLHEREWQGR